MQQAAQPTANIKKNKSRMREEFQHRTLDIGREGKRERGGGGYAWKIITVGKDEKEGRRHPGQSETKEEARG